MCKINTNNKHMNIMRRLPSKSVFDVTFAPSWCKGSSEDGESAVVNPTREVKDLVMCENSLAFVK